MAIILNFGGKNAFLILFHSTVFVHHYRSDSFSNHSCYLSVMKSKFVDGDLRNNDVKLRHLSELVFGTVHSSTSLPTMATIKVEFKHKTWLQGPGDNSDRPCVAEGNTAGAV